MKALRFLLPALFLLTPFLSTTSPVTGHRLDGSIEIPTQPILEQSTGSPHSSFYNTALYPSGWFTETIDDTCNSGESAALAWGNSANGKVAYHQKCGATDTLKYAYQIDFLGNKIWMKDTVGPSSPILYDQRGIDLALDQDGTAFISYLVYSGSEYGQDLRVARQGEVGWYIKELPHVGDQGPNTSIAVRDDWVYLSFYDVTPSYIGSLRFMYFDIFGAFPPTPLPVDGGGDKLIESEITLRSDGQPRIVYSDSTSPALKYAATGDYGLHWNLTTLVPGVDGRQCSIVVDINNSPRISYYNNLLDDLDFISYNLLFGWDDPQKVDGDGLVVGKFTSIALNASGRSRIAYYDETNHNLKYAEQQSDKSWRVITVDSLGDVGMYASLAFDPAGNPHIAYYDKTNTRLLHAYYNSPVFLPLVLH